MCMYSCRAGRLGSQAALVFYGAPPLITTNCRWAPAHFLNTSDESVYLYSSSCSYKSCKILKNTAKTTAIVWGWRGACSELNRSIHYVFTASGNLVTIHLGWCMASCEASAFLHIKNVKTEDINLQSAVLQWVKWDNWQSLKVLTKFCGIFPIFLIITPLPCWKHLLFSDRPCLYIWDYSDVRQPKH